MVGGSQGVNRFDAKNDDVECQQIIDRCSRLIPSIKTAPVAGKAAGLRPCRKGNVRLEMETIKNTKVIHNYVLLISLLICTHFFSFFD